MSRTVLIPTVSRRRMIVDKMMSALIIAAVVIAVAALVLILADTVIQGLPVINLDFLTNTPRPVGISGGGIGPDIVGTFTMVGLASLIAVPIGIGAGVFFSEWPESRLSFVSSFTNDVLAEFPSMVIGIFVWVVLVFAMHSFSALAGAIALAIIMIPIVARTTEESLKIVPRTLREASIALGVSRWKTIVRIVMSTGKAGLVTGILLAVARAAGETAPLLVTALGNSFYAKSIFEPTGAIPLFVFDYAISPYQIWHSYAWGAALVLIAIMLALNLTVRLVIKKNVATRAEI